MKILRLRAAGPAKGGATETIEVRLAIELDPAWISPDERRQIGPLTTDAVRSSLRRRPWFLRATVIE
jgi:hypothetical protein